MAGDMHWFRWHHGSVTDPKFKLVAKRAGVSLPDVLAVWAALLEAASAAAERGTFGDFDCEAFDCAFDFDDGCTARIMDAMRQRGLIDEHVVASWGKRQPKRERDDPETSTDRVKKHRGAKSGEPPDGTSGNHETPRNATKRHETPRGEERRVIPPDPPAGAATEVDEFLAEFPVPRRIKTDQARQLFADAVASGEVVAQQLVQAIRHQAVEQREAWAREGGRFAPTPARWLRERRWRDGDPERGGAEGWAQSRSGIEAMGEKLGLGRWQQDAFDHGRGEAFPVYEGRVRTALRDSGGQSAVVSH